MKKQEIYDKWTLFVTEYSKYFKTRKSKQPNKNMSKPTIKPKREKETLKFIVIGYTNQQISEEMNVSPHTIRTHRNRIWKKLDITLIRDCLKYKCFFN